MSHSSETNETFDIAVIGAGTGGLVAAFLADSLGAKTALIERDRIGGECLWTGCVPSKALIKSARVFDTIQRAEEFGVHVEKPRVVWGAITMRIAAVRDELKVLERQELGKTAIEIIHGEARFTAANELRVATPDGERTVRAAKFILATGTAVDIPAIEGLESAGFITHEQVFSLPNKPRALVIVGGGPIGCEMAQAFARLGTKVTMLQRGAVVLPKEDAEISALALKVLQQDGVTVYLNAAARQAGQDDKGQKWIEFEDENGGAQTVRATEIFIATGKKTALESLHLEAAGVETDQHGLVVDEYLRSSAPHVWACGDVTGKYFLTHVAEYQGKIAAQNALLPVPAKADYRVVPWTTFTDPEVAHLGLTEAEAKAEIGDYKVFRQPFAKLDRAVIEGETQGFLKVITTGSGRIVGAHIIGPEAGELIHAFVPAVRDGGLIQEMGETIHVYPTLSEIAHRAGNAYYQELLNARSTQWLLRRAGDVGLIAANKR